MKTVFVDRDGTMGGSGGGNVPGAFKLYKETASAFRLLNQYDFSIIMITNQSKIARGLFTEEEFAAGTNQLLAELKQQGAFVLDYFYCPHQRSDNCSCKKPQTAMIDSACQKYPSIDLKNAYFIGDNGQNDMLLAARAGIGKILVRTGWGESSLTTHRYFWEETEADNIAQNIWEAAKWLVSSEK